MSAPMAVLDFLEEELAGLERKHRRRIARVGTGPQAAHVVVDGREVVSFSSNDYLGLASHPGLREAARAAIERSGVGAGSSRLIAGNFEAHAELERVAAGLLGTESARLFNSGFAANTGLLPVLAGAADQIFSDELNHASIIDGSRLSRATVRVFGHGKLSDLEEMLSGAREGRRVIVTESVFSMDGDLADLVGLREIADRYGAILVVDDAHALGVYGERGAGLIAARGIRTEATVVTLGKALGAYGAIVAGSRSLSEVLWNRARSLVFTTGLPPMIAASAIAAIAIVQGEEGDRRRRDLWARIGQLVSGLAELGIEVAGTSPIVPLLVGGDRDVMSWTSRLLELGIYVQGVRPPTVPEGTARLRVALSAGHSEEDVGRLLAAIRSGLDAGARFVSRGTVP
jgi:8-amino-7-oxononanoate synthase